MLTQLPRVPSLIPSSFATRAIGRDVSITIFTASSLNSGEKLFFGRGNYFTFPDGPSYWMDCPEGSGHLIQTNVAGWPSWQPDVDGAQAGGPLTVGSVFRWQTAGLDITSTVTEVPPTAPEVVGRQVRDL